MHTKLSTIDSASFPYTLYANDLFVIKGYQIKIVGEEFMFSAADNGWIYGILIYFKLNYIPYISAYE